MSQKLVKMTVIAAITVSLSGCAQISKLGNNMWEHTQNAWGYTKSAASFVASPVTKLLRSTPEQVYVFEDSTRAQHMAKTAFAMDSHPERVRPVYRAQPQKLDYQSSAHQPKSYQVAQNVESSRIEYVAQTRAKQSRNTPYIQQSTSRNISFVKMGGGSNMYDWLTCEAEAGGFVRVVQGGYLIEPEFESCMRGRGYKPESEVADSIRDDTVL